MQAPSQTITGQAQLALRRPPSARILPTGCPVLSFGAKFRVIAELAFQSRSGLLDNGMRIVAMGVRLQQTTAPWRLELRAIRCHAIVYRLAAKIHPIDNRPIADAHCPAVPEECRRSAFRRSAIHLQGRIRAMA